MRRRLAMAEDLKLHAIERAIETLKSTMRALDDLGETEAGSRCRQAISELVLARKRMTRWRPKPGDIIEIHACLDGDEVPWKLESAGRYKIRGVNSDSEYPQMSLERLGGGF
jgi:hypothetical protein